MYLVKLRPCQLKKAVNDNIPVVLAAGSVEYHGPHLPIGTDFLIAESIIEAVEKRIPNGCVVAPPLPFSSTMNWAGGAHEGDLDFEPGALHVYAREVFSQLTKIGFRRIYALQHHQGPEGLPSLTLRKAAAEAVHDITKRWGHSWGRLALEDTPEPNIFGLIKIAYLDTYSDCSGEVPVGHGGKGETQLIMAGYPETVEMEELAAWEGELPQWLHDADQATIGEGKRWLEKCIDGWVRELQRT